MRKKWLSSNGMKKTAKMTRISATEFNVIIVIFSSASGGYKCKCVRVWVFVWLMLRQKMAKIKRDPIQTDSLPSLFPSFFSPGFAPISQAEAFHFKWFTISTLGTLSVCAQHKFQFLSFAPIFVVVAAAVAVHRDTTMLLLLFIHLHQRFPNEFSCKQHYYCYWYVIIVCICMRTQSSRRQYLYGWQWGKMATKECIVYQMHAGSGNNI